MLQLGYQTDCVAGGTHENTVEDTYFIGLTEIEWVYAEGLAFGPETGDLSLGAANRSIAELESAAVAA